MRSISNTIKKAIGDVVQITVESPMKIINVYMLNNDVAIRGIMKEFCLKGIHHEVNELMQDPNYGAR